jgi:poly-gamma-glutamate synthesis protein (capsule biosynthesis protein)
MVYESAGGDITMAFTGDAMISRALTPFREPRFLELRDLFHSQDVSITNGEMLFHNYEDWPAYLSQTYMRCDPRFIKDLQWLGLDMMGCANNHGTDYGENGVLTNIRYLDEAGMVHAGSGTNYAEALAPAYMDTPKGRVALISATTSARPNSRAGEQRPDLNGRPGVNLIRWINEWTVDEEAFHALDRIAQKFRWRQSVPGWMARAYGLGAEAGEQTVYFHDRNILGVGSEDPAARFVLGDDFEVHSKPHQIDLERNVQSVGAARRMADWVVFALHSHEGGKEENEPAEHVELLAHAVIDAGADVFIGHGPHLDRGIEVYKGKPIIYSLGNFIVQNDTVDRMPHDSMVLYGLGHDNVPADLFETRRAGSRREYPGTDPHTQSAIATVTFDSGGLRELRLHPIEFGRGQPRSVYGRPILSQGAEAQETLERFQRLSGPFQTQLSIEGEVGVLRRN